MALERDLDDAPLHAAAPAMNDAEIPQAGLVRGPNVLVDDGRDVLRKKGVQIQLGTDRQVVDHRHGFVYEAVTLVVMPPRALKAPVTVIARG